MSHLLGCYEHLTPSRVDIPLQALKLEFNGELFPVVNTAITTK